MDKEIRELIRDILNEIYEEEEIENLVDIKKCSVCGSYELEEDLTNHKWDIGEIDELICQTCKESE